MLITLHGAQQPALSIILRSDHTTGEIRKLADGIRKQYSLLKQHHHVHAFTGHTYRTGNPQNAAG